MKYSFTPKPADQKPNPNFVPPASVKVTSNDRELILCKRKSDGVEGIYDTEEKTFKTFEEYFPRTTKTFDVPYPPVEYINENSNLIIIGEKYIKPPCSLCDDHHGCDNCYYGQVDSKIPNEHCEDCDSSLSEWTPLGDNYCRNCGRKLKSVTNR